MSDMNNIQNIEPRVSILEKGQESLQRDLKDLAHSVKEQGIQLGEAIVEISKTQNVGFSQLSDKITNAGKTDWQTVVAFIGVGCVIITAIFSPVWMAFNYTDKNHNNLEKIVDTQGTIIMDGAKERASLSAKIESLQNNFNKLENRFYEQNKPTSK